MFDVVPYVWFQSFLCPKDQWPEMVSFMMCKRFMMLLPSNQHISLPLKFPKTILAFSWIIFGLVDL